jgi:hypothetical protein
MASVSGLFVVFALVFAVGGGLLLYSLVRQEHGQRQAMDRTTAEQVARRDTGDGPSRGRDADGRHRSDADDGNHWDDTGDDDSAWGDRR